MLRLGKRSLATPRAVFAFLAPLVLLAVACGSDDDGDVAPAVGTVVDEQSLELGRRDIDVRLAARSAEPLRLLVPMGALPQPRTVVVRASTGVTRNGPPVPTMNVLQVATRSVVLTPTLPARVVQPAVAPPPGRRYVVVTAQEDAVVWTVTGTPVRRSSLPVLPTTDGSVAGALTAAAVTVDTPTWEFEVTGSGLWAMGLVDEVRPDGGVDAGVGQDAGAPDASAMGDGGTVVRDAGGDARLVSAIDPAPTRNTPGLFTVQGGPSLAVDDFFLDLGRMTTHAFEGNVAGAVGNGTFYVVKTADAQGLPVQGLSEVGGTIPTNVDGAFLVTVPLFCGTQLVKCVWTNAAGPAVLVTQIVTSNCVEPDIRATISWDDKGRDWELHLVKPGGTINDNATDCTWTSCIGAAPDWGVVNDPSDDPSKDVDNTGSFGPENIFLAKPETGRYTVLVEHWGAGAPSTGQAIINVRGRATIVPIADFVSQHVRTVATIDWPSGVVTTVNSNYDCSAQWSSGCKAKLP